MTHNNSSFINTLIIADKIWNERQLNVKMKTFTFIFQSSHKFVAQYMLFKNIPLFCGNKLDINWKLLKNPIFLQFRK
ncbi:hypothetical protein CD33_04845 [Ureibacillus sinduriensis BLB-1 = JCM 15800]|uniref:Uncharacterized protein n=1 Tax=Ureibacillus sinduriensis BLB-1 = JCM 15800 TaxID=1384057 RepID=A0A0A3IPM3_9BACL|nr:hypothetical protein CD33_04845 [Ureibacillus sinduriensis BLB-1 = JCM 15800]